MSPVRPIAEFVNPRYIIRATLSQDDNPDLEERSEVTGESVPCVLHLVVDDGKGDIHHMSKKFESEKAAGTWCGARGLIQV